MIKISDSSYLLKKALLETMAHQFLLYQCGGFCFSVYCMLVYRRMINYRALPFLSNVAIDFLLLGTSLLYYIIHYISGFSWLGVNLCMNKSRELRKELLESSDIGYLKHLVQQYRTYSYFQKDEYFIYQDVLSKQEFY